MRAAPLHTCPRVYVVGLMSGTSVDAIDAALVDVAEDGDTLRAHLLAYTETPHDPLLRRRILRLCQGGPAPIAEVADIHVRLGERFGAAAAALCDGARVRPDLVASHGQTVWHAVDAFGQVTATLQLGESAAIAEIVGCPVVADFRPRDVAAGGQGAPLSSYPDYLLFADPRRGRAVQNIGGIGNVTWIPPGASPAQVIAFDTGPGNVLIDRAVQRLTDGAEMFDRDGRRALGGQVNEPIVREVLAMSFFDRPPPRTTGRELFGEELADRLVGEVLAGGGSPDDAIATLTAITVRSIAEAYRRFLPAVPDDVVLGGGGARNPAIVRGLTTALGVRSRVLDHEAFGVPSSGREAIYFAVLGHEAVRGRANSLPACTGARYVTILGKVTPALGRRIEVDLSGAPIRRLTIDRRL